MSCCRLLGLRESDLHWPIPLCVRGDRSTPDSMFRSHADKHSSCSPCNYKRRHPGNDRPDQKCQGKQALVAGSSRPCVDIRCDRNTKCRQRNRQRSVQRSSERRVPKSKEFEPNVTRKCKTANQPRRQPPNKLRRV